MSCFHGVEGFCLVCAKKLEQTTDCAHVFRRLHLQAKGSPGVPLCGSPVGPEERFSTLASHDTSRFCQACLKAVYAQREAERRAWQRERAARPFLEKVEEFNDRLRNPGDYDKLPLAFFAISFILVLLVLSGTAFIFADLEAAGVVFLVSGVVLWYFAVRAFG